MPRSGFKKLQRGVERTMAAFTMMRAAEIDDQMNTFIGVTSTDPQNVKTLDDVFSKVASKRTNPKTRLNELSGMSGKDPLARISDFLVSEGILKPNSQVSDTRTSEMLREIARAVLATDALQRAASEDPRFEAFRGQLPSQIIPRVQREIQPRTERLTADERAIITAGSTLANGDDALLRATETNQNVESINGRATLAVEGLEAAKNESEYTLLPVKSVYDTADTVIKVTAQFEPATYVQVTDGFENFIRRLPPGTADRLDVVKNEARPENVAEAANAYLRLGPADKEKVRVSPADVADAELDQAVRGTAEEEIEEREAAHSRRAIRARGAVRGGEGDANVAGSRGGL